jgi:hypothetical protein
MLFLLCFLLAGCFNKHVDHDPDIFYQEPYSVLSQAKVKSKDAVHKLALLEEFELDVPGNITIKDSYIKDKNAYLLVGNKILQTNLTNMRLKIIDANFNADKIIAFDDQLGIYQKNKSTQLFLYKNSKFTTHNFGGLISNVIPYENNIIVVMTNGLCIYYDYNQKKEIWRSVAHNQYKHGLKSSAVFQDNIIFVDPLGRLTLIDIDNGTIKGYQTISECTGKSTILTEVTQDGLFAMVDENLLVGLAKDGEINYTKLKIKDLKAIFARGNYLILESSDHYLITDASHIFNGKFISKVPKESVATKIFIHKKTFCVVDEKGANFYRINTGNLIQRISANVTYSGSNSGKFYLLANKQVSVYN